MSRIGKHPVKLPQGVTAKVDGQRVSVKGPKGELAFTAAEAQAASGFTVTTSRESVVAIGMSTSEVEQLLGRPARAVRYRNTPGPVWTYRVVDPLFGRTEFNIEFGSDERVMAKGEVVIGSDSPSRGRP